MKIAKLQSEVSSVHHDHPYYLSSPKKNQVLILNKEKYSQLQKKLIYYKQCNRRNIIKSQNLENIKKL